MITAKKLICIVIALVLAMPFAISTSAESTSSSNRIRMLYNNEFIESDQDPVLINGRTLVPMRVIFETLGADIAWDSETKTATAVRGGKEVRVTVDSEKMFVNGVAKALDVPPSIINGRTMIPVRAVAEAFDCIVRWNGYAQYVIIMSKDQIPYKIDAVNSQGVVLATAYFDSFGRLIKTYSNAKDDLAHCWLAPFYVNVNGNTYIDQMRSAVNGDGLNTLRYDDAGNMISFVQNSTTSYTYEYKSNGVRRNSALNGNILNQVTYNYDGKVCEFANGFGAESGQPQFDKLIFNDMGLLKEYLYYAMRIEWEYDFEYDEDGHMIAWYYSGGSTQTAHFDYDISGRIKSASHHNTATGTTTEVTYKYTLQQ